MFIFKKTPASVKSYWLQKQAGVSPFQVQGSRQLALAPYQILSLRCCSSGLFLGGTARGRNRLCHRQRFWWRKPLGHCSNPGGLFAWAACCCSCTQQDWRAPWSQAPLPSHFHPVYGKPHKIIQTHTHREIFL